MAKPSLADRAAEQAERAARKARRVAQMAEDAKAERADTPADEEISDIAALFEGLPQSSDIRLYRKAKVGGKLEYCQSFVDASDFSEEGVADKWGPGTYRLIARVPDPKTGKPQFAPGRTKTFTIAERPGESGSTRGTTREPQNFEQTMAAQMFTMMTGQMQMQQQMMMQSQESHRAMLAMMMQRPPDSGSELVKLVLPALLTRPPDSGSELVKLVLPALLTKSDPMELSMKMAELLKPAGPTAGLVEQLTVLEKFMELARKGESPDGDKPAWLEALKAVTPLIDRAMQVSGAPARLPAPPAAIAPAAAPVPALAAPAPPPAIEPSATAGQPLDLLTELDRLIPLLVIAATKASDVELQADWFLEMVPEAMFEALDTALATPGMLDQLGARYPAVLIYRSWFERFLAAVGTALQPEDETEVEDVPGNNPSPAPSQTPTP